MYTYICIYIYVCVCVTQRFCVIYQERTMATMAFHFGVAAWFQWAVCPKFSGPTEVPNVVALQREALPAQQLQDFRCRWLTQEKYRVAANLWANGRMSWQQALDVAKSAFQRQ